MSAHESALARQPILAFAGVASVLVAAGAELSGLAQAGIEVRARSARTEDDHRGSNGDFDLCDRHGKTLASFVDRWVLSVCPQAAWQAHTPDHMARVLADTLGDGRSPEEILARLMPDADGEGWVQVQAWTLTARTAIAVDELLREKAWPGIRLVEQERGSGRWRLAWQPAVLLSKAARGETTQPWTWTRNIADSLGAALDPEPLPEKGEERAEALNERRERVWAGLLPNRFSIVAEDVRPDRLTELRELFADERVGPLHFLLECQRERVHPVGELSVLGTWGFLGDELGEATPRGGLEELGARLFEQPELAELLAAPAVYRWRSDRVVRHAARPYFLSSRPPGSVPTLVSTIDLELMRDTRAVLEGVLEEHGAAMAQAIVIEVESGGVLAVDSVSRYPYGLFAPTQHLFTPGSTLKPVTMAVALEHGLVHPDEIIDVGPGDWKVPGAQRRVGEARGHRVGRITATECLAYSSNAGMIQIGQRVPQELYEPHLWGMGYERVPAIGFRGAQAGWIGHPREERWKLGWTHASVCFGHESATTLWQHAAALATLVRGGEYRELSIFRGVDRAGDWYGLPESGRETVFAPETCAEVRRMMQVGAWEGTGKHIWRGDLAMGTKTGTVEKVTGEPCEHARGVAIENGRELRAEDRWAVPHPTCYTSLIVAFGRPPGGGAEHMVLVCVEEPTQEKRFGSQVAGPAALALLESSLGVQRPGPESEESGAESPARGSAPSASEAELLELQAPTPSGFVRATHSIREGSSRPWAERSAARTEVAAW